MFVKKDEGFICKNCGKRVEKLGYTSRDHCKFCLWSLHVDVTPGDRLSNCKGNLKPINILTSSKKEMQIEYVCEVCKSKVKNIVAADDSKDEIYNIVKSYATYGGK